jgi:hypothetical protein
VRFVIFVVRFLIFTPSSGAGSFNFYLPAQAEVPAQATSDTTGFSRVEFSISTYQGISW